MLLLVVEGSPRTLRNLILQTTRPQHAAAWFLRSTLSYLRGDQLDVALFLQILQKVG